MLFPPLSYSANNETSPRSSSQLVSAVLQANPRLEIARATWQASVAKIAPLSALDDPQLNYSVAPLTVSGHKSGVAQRFEISQKIPFPGTLPLRQKMAEYQADTKQHDIVTLQLLLATLSKSRFADWYFVHQAIKINQQNQSLLKAFKTIATTRYSTGQGNKQAVLHTAKEHALLRHQLIALQRQQKTLLAQINTLLNKPVYTVLNIPTQLTPLGTLPPLQQLQARAIRSHPALKNIATTLNLYKAASQLAALAYYPDIKLSAGYNSLWDNEDKRFTLGVGINLPLNQTKRQAAEQAAKANSQQAHWQKIDLHAKINEQLAIAYAQAEESLHILHLHQQHLLPLADESISLANANYHAGQGDYLTVLQQKKNKLTTQLQAEQALTDVHHHFAQLEQIIGSLAPLSAHYPEVSNEN